MHTHPLRSGSLRFAPFGAHGRVHACFATHARSILTRGYSCPLKPQIGQTFSLRGQPPLIVSARLLVARANRAVTVFASFSSLVPTLSIVCAVCSSFAPPHSSVTLIRFTQHPFFIPGQEPSFAHSFRFVPFILPLRNPPPSLLHAIPFYRFFPNFVINPSSNGNSLHSTSLNRSFRHLPFPAQAPFAKNCAGPAARGSIPLPSLRCGLPAACALAPLAYGSRLSLRLR